MKKTENLCHQVLLVLGILSCSVNNYLTRQISSGMNRLLYNTEIEGYGGARTAYFQPEVESANLTTKLSHKSLLNSVFNTEPSPGNDGSDLSKNSSTWSIKATYLMEKCQITLQSGRHHLISMYRVKIRLWSWLCRRDHAPPWKELHTFFIWLLPSLTNKLETLVKTAHQVRYRMFCVCPHLSCSVFVMGVEEPVMDAILTWPSVYVKTWSS